MVNFGLPLICFGLSCVTYGIPVSRSTAGSSYWFLKGEIPGANHCVDNHNQLIKEKIMTYSTSCIQRCLYIYWKCLHGKVYIWIWYLYNRDSYITEMVI